MRRSKVSLRRLFFWMRHCIEFAFFSLLSINNDLQKAFDGSQQIEPELDYSSSLVLFLFLFSSRLLLFFFCCHPLHARIHMSLSLLSSVDDHYIQIYIHIRVRASKRPSNHSILLTTSATLLQFNAFVSKSHRTFESVGHRFVVKPCLRIRVIVPSNFDES